jgi:hypothetical protein
MRRIALVAFALLVSTSAFLACGDTESASGPTDTTDAGNEAASAETGPIGFDSGGECTGIEQGAVSVDITTTKAPLPTPTGGVPTDGVYVLTKVTAFTALFDEGFVLRAFGAYTLALSSDTTVFEQVVNSPDGTINRARGTLIKDGLNATATPSCESPANPDGGVTVLSGTYSVEGTTLKLYVVRELNITAELVFEKR